MWWSKATLSTALLLALFGCHGSTFKTERDQGASRPEWAGKQATVAGIVPLSYVIRELFRLEMLSQYPARPDSTQIQIDTKSRLDWGTVIAAIETQTGWIYDHKQKAFYEPTATHPVDSPDPAGRTASQYPLQRSRRSVVEFAVAFRRASAGGSISSVTVNGGANQIVFVASGIEGVPHSWSQTTERGYDVAIRDLNNPVAVNSQVVTEHKTVPSGLDVSAIVARLPGNYARVSGSLSVSAFVGTTLDRTSVNIPLDYDLPRWQWVKVYHLNSWDVNARASLHGIGFDLAGSADGADVMIKVD